MALTGTANDPFVASDQPPALRPTSRPSASRSGPPLLPESVSASWPATTRPPSFSSGSAPTVPTMPWENFHIDRVSVGSVGWPMV